MLQKSSISEVLKVFFREPSKKHSLKDVSRATGIAHTSVKRDLTHLIENGLIRKEIEKKGKRKFPAYASLANETRFKRYKMLDNLASLIDSGLIDFIEDKLAPKAIVVFGSFRRGEDSEDSDIDLFVEGIEEELDLKHYEKKLKRKIELHFNEDFRSYPKELKNNIMNGVVLQGFLEGYK